MTDRRTDVPGLPRWHSDPFIRDAIDRIRRYGLSITIADQVCADHAKDPFCEACAHAYTSGHSLAGEPELAVYGLGGDNAGDVLCDVAEELAHRDWLRVVDEETSIEVESLDVPLRLIEMVDKSDMRVTNVLFPDAPVLQVVWPDDDGFYPWDEEYALKPHNQFLRGVQGFARDVGPRVISRSTGPNRAQRRKRKR